MPLHQLNEQGYRGHTHARADMEQQQRSHRQLAAASTGGQCGGRTWSNAAARMPWPAQPPGSRSPQSAWRQPCAAQRWQPLMPRLLHRCLPATAEPVTPTRCRWHCPREHCSRCCTSPCHSRAHRISSTVLSQTSWAAQGIQHGMGRLLAGRQLTHAHVPIGTSLKQQGFEPRSVGSTCALDRAPLSSTAQARLVVGLSPACLWI